jgi:hypothetical protein
MGLIDKIEFRKIKQQTRAAIDTKQASISISIRLTGKKPHIYSFLILSYRIY